MATITTGGSGNWSSTTVNAPWPGGVVPTPLVDKINIASGHTVTFDKSPFVITGGSGYTSKPTVTLGGATGSGATAVAIMSNVDGTGSVVGIKVMQPGASYTVPTVTFTGGSPTVAATATATVYNGRFAYAVGDDTTTALNIKSGGILSWSTSVTTAMSLYGSLVVENGGEFRCGNSTTPIPDTVAHSIFMNDSSALAQVKYGITCGTGANKFFVFGASKTINTFLTSTANSGQANAVVDDVTGWNIGDRVWLAPTNSAYTQKEEKIISSISGNTVTFTTNLSYTHLADGRIGNADNNILFAPATIGLATVYNGYIYIPNGASTAADSREFQYATFETGGDASTATKLGALLFEGVSLSVNTVNTIKGVRHCAFRNFGTLSSTASLYVRANFVPFEAEDCGFYCTTSAATPIAFRNGGIMTGIGLIAYGSNSSFLTSYYEQGSIGSSFTDCIIHGCTAVISIGTGTLNFTRTTIDACQRLMSSPNFSNVKFNNCELGMVYGFLTPPIVTPSLGCLPTWQFTDCNFGFTSTDFITTSALANINQDSEIKLVNKNEDVTLQEVLTYAGDIERDNSLFYRSPSSEKFSPQTVSRAFTRTYVVPAPNNTLRRVVGYLRYDSTYGATTPPTVTLSGLGITPQTYTAGGTHSTWYQFDLSATQTSGADGNLTLTITGLTTATTGAFWVDGIVDAPLVTSSRHYGFLFDSLIYRTADSIITQTTEATVGAYTGISITGSTITLTSDHSIEELYDYCKWYLCQTANLGVADFFSSTDGINFSSTYNLTLNGGDLTGTGSLNLGAGTLTVTAGETTTVPITYSSGTAVYGNVTVSGLVANSRVRLYNTTDATELYNAVVAGTSTTIPATWTANKDLELSVTNCPGPVPAYLPYSSTNTLTSSMASFTASQALDTTYNANAIDGSTVTEFSADYPNIQVDIDDADGTTSVARLYAAFQYMTHSSQGIIYFFNGIIAGDQYNYEIQTAVVDLELDNISATSIPIKISGAYLYRDDGTTVIYSGSKSIQLDPGKAYLANGDNALGVINRNVQKASLLIPATEEI